MARSGEHPEHNSARKLLELRAAEQARRRHECIQRWVQTYSISKRTATRWFDAGMRPAVSPFGESGPFLTFEEVAARLHLKPAAMRKFLQRQRPELGSADLSACKIVPVPWNDAVKNFFTESAAAGRAF